LQGRQHTYFCGAWMGYGFHEDGLKAGLSVARQLLIETEQLAMQALAVEAAHERRPAARRRSRRSAQHGGCRMSRKP
jgi:predicted NAD/FAD-binding protein